MSDQSNPAFERQIQLAIDILKKGGIVAFPTDTVYGLGASAFIDRAAERVYEVKQRPRHIPLPLLLGDTSQIVDIADSVSEITWCLVEWFLPGALTIILHKAKSVPEIITAGGNTVAVRIPNHPVPIALIQGLGAPITGTSANLSGEPSPLTAEDVYRQMGNGIDFIIDGGRCPGGVESTVIDMTSETPVIVREGAVSREEIERVCGSVILE